MTDDIKCPNCGEKEELGVEFVGSASIDKIKDNKVYTDPFYEPNSFYCAACGTEWEIGQNIIVIS